MSNFLPENYKAPEGSSQFMKLKEGANKFRICSEAVIGWEGWKNNKPFRVKAVVGQDCPIKETDVDFDNTYGRPKINHFWAFTVWNYEEKKVQVLEITQKSIMRAIENYYIMEEWGDPRQYDLTIKRDETGGKVQYSVLASPPKELSAEVGGAVKASKVELEKLFSGEYPMDEVKTDEVPF